ncbi:MAG: ATP-binding protein [Chloroflexi bacterium]|nr:ATP-binding protein [Chloroflexota bacterium]
MSEQHFHAAYPGRFSSLRLISSFVREAAQKTGLDDCTIYAVETAVDEACSNIIEHAYGAEDMGEIQCECRVLPDRLIIILKDQGKPFDPSAIAAPNLEVSLEERTDHGLGLYFMRQMMDDVRFDFVEGVGNILTMVKMKEKPG